MTRFALALLFGVTSPAAAQAVPCSPPAALPVPHAEGASAAQPARTVPIGGYTLSLIWAPQHCRAAIAGADRLKCADIGGRGLVLHGLWPDGTGRDFPQWCAEAAIVPPRVLAAAWCTTPSVQLLEHEWAKHGTCIAGATPAGYFAQSNRLFAAIRAPDMDALSHRRGLTAAAFARAFAGANPQWPASAVRVALDRRGWLEEVRLCLDTRYAPARCPAEPAEREPVRIWRWTR